MTPIEAAENEALRKELVGLFQYIQRVRREIAAISRPADEDHKFESMGDQLDAIVKATEHATDVIMGCMEKNDSIIAKLKEGASEEQSALLNEIEENDRAVIEACSFQDITGQRVSKVVKSVTYVEDRVNALIDVWGKTELEKVEVEKVEKSEDEKLLHGPQNEDTAISQSEIDALFD
ncbi:MAG: protein phosphatase CheZ [Rhodospirillales bacterium]|nr:protein phosphatase CheZ [Rhodospirillales bacterium]